jgi:hypothetical protein
MGTNFKEKGSPALPSSDIWILTSGLYKFPASDS